MKRITILILVALFVCSIGIVRAYGPASVTRGEVSDSIAADTSRYARLYKSDSLTVDTASAGTKVSFDRTSYFSNCTPDTTSNYRVTVPEAGKYQVNACVWYNNDGDNVTCWIAIYYNGGVVAKGCAVASAASSVPVAVNVYDIVDMAASGYIEIYAFVIDNAGSTESYKTCPGTTQCYVSLAKIK